MQSRLATDGRPVPVVIITGHDTDEARERAMKGGAAAYLRKPVDDQVLLDTISAAVAGKAAH